jgi:predicted Rdx family selenoprotein
LAASLDKHFGEKVSIKAGKTGQFDVIVDGQVIFSKGKVGRFPVEGEVEDRFAEIKSGVSAADKPQQKQESGARAGVLSRIAGKLRG